MTKHKTNAVTALNCLEAPLWWVCLAGVYRCFGLISLPTPTGTSSCWAGIVEGSSYFGSLRYCSLALASFGNHEVFHFRSWQAEAQDVDPLSYQRTWSKNIDDAHSIVVMSGWFRLCLFWYSSIITARMLKASLGQAKLAMIQITLADGFWDVMHLMLIFLVVFNNFAVGGKILFGPELEDWSTYPQCCASAVLLMMGSAKFDQLFQVAPISATIWYWLFILMMMFLMLNLLTVIIVEHFCQTRNTCGDTAGILRDLKLAWRDLMFRLEWRRDQFREGEYKACFLSNPYEGLTEGLLQNAKASPEMERAAAKNCLGLKLNRKKIEDLSVEAPSADANPGFGIVKNLELRKIACDAATAQFLLDGCEEFIVSEKSQAHLGVLNQVRSFVKLLKQSKEQLDFHCQMMEEGIVEDQEELEIILTRLEDSVQMALDGFEEPLRRKKSVS